MTVKTEATPARQLPLALRGDDEATLDLFVADAAFVQFLRDVAAGTCRDWVWLHGPAGRGKTHLLTGLTIADNRSAGYLDAPALLAAGPECLAQLQGFDLVCVDNFERLVGPEWDEAWFHQINRWRDAGVQLIIASSLAPRALPFSLPDLQSRVHQMVEMAIPKLTPEGRARLLASRAQARGYSLPPEVISYLLSREARGAGELMALLDRLGLESLSAQRKLTVPFVRQVLASSRLD